MFVGHYSVAFALKSEKNEIPFWVLFARKPLSDKATAMGVWIFYTLFVVVAFLIERIGSPRQTDAS
jgi:hypothetical protein